MKTLIAILLLLGLSTNWSALGGGAGLNVPQTSQGDGILKSIQNAGVTQSGEDLVVTRKDARTPIELVFIRCQGLGVQYQDNQWWVLPVSASGAQVDANKALWVLPVDATSKDRSWYIALHGGNLHAKMTEAGLTLTLDAESVTLSRAMARPHSDAFGHRFSLEMPGGAEL